MPLVERLGLPPFEITGVLAVVKYNVGQAVPVIKAIPQAERLRHAIQAIDETNNHDLLARWDDYGYATYDQLKQIEKVVVAKNNFALVQATVDWIETVEFQVEDIVEPFKDTLDITKVDYKAAVEDLNLGEWFFGRHPLHGCEFLDFVRICGYTLVPSSGRCLCYVKPLESSTPGSWTLTRWSKGLVSRGLMEQRILA
ncbi:hypothetical protein PR003_g33108 [Phytophthora rubi]|uniref:Uncharacterized protein n=1 Tax=Phytophthora rubi TaxID=129364 RepID=A0A6A3GCN0_9STRA|nr:hypothetical protein PR002_g31991 [Phytophthora rubi]KAE9263582.1 hypothetical protein PR003_g33108 [Phytophthora rubi]